MLESDQLGDKAKFSAEFDLAKWPRVVHLPAKN